jgi:hypothetical protein
MTRKRPHFELKDNRLTVNMTDIERLRLQRLAKILDTSESETIRLAINYLTVLDYEQLIRIPMNLEERDAQAEREARIADAYKRITA